MFVTAEGGANFNTTFFKFLMEDSFVENVIGLRPKSSLLFYFLFSR
jgi:hypothetical protein